MTDEMMRRRILPLTLLVSAALNYGGCWYSPTQDVEANNESQTLSEIKAEARYLSRFEPEYAEELRKANYEKSKNW
jgi:uncharacterized protein (DUF2126 family)